MYPSLASMIFNELNIYFNAGKFAKAREMLDALQKLDDSNGKRNLYAMALVVMIFAYGNKGDLAEARAVFDANSDALIDILYELPRCNDNKRSGYLGEVIKTFVCFAAMGRPKESLRLIKDSGSEEYLEPLVVCLRRMLGEKVWVAREIHEVAKDVAEEIKRIEGELAEKALHFQSVQPGNDPA
jgi:tetratricopeptide (TPR) repeat protein